MYDSLTRDLIKSGVGKHYHCARLDGIVSQIVRADIEKFVLNIGENLNTGHGILIAGTKGSGKTCIMAIIAKAILCYWHEERMIWDKKLRFEMAYDIMRFGSRNDDYYEQTRTKDALIVDDLGAEYSHDFPLSTFTAIMEYRQANLLSTFITTNMGLARLADPNADEYKKYSRIIDRMSDSSRFDIFELDERSLRK